MPPAKNSDPNAGEVDEFAAGKPLYDTIDSKTFVEAQRIHAIAERAQLEVERIGCEVGPLTHARAGGVASQAQRESAAGNTVYGGVDMEVLDAVNCLLEAGASDADFRNHPMLNPSKFAAELA